MHVELNLTDLDRASNALSKLLGISNTGETIAREQYLNTCSDQAALIFEARALGDNSLGSSIMQKSGYLHNVDSTSVSGAFDEFDAVSYHSPMHTYLPI